MGETYKYRPIDKVENDCKSSRYSFISYTPCLYISQRLCLSTYVFFLL